MKLDPIEFPAVLYKYRAFSKYGLDILRSDEVFFSSPDKLNDPLDCALPIRYDIGTYKQMYRLTIRMLAYGNPTMSRKEIKRRAAKIAELTYANRHEPQIMRESNEGTYKIMSKEWSVFSLSACPKDEVMWGHYGDSHTGFCIGFSTEKLKVFQARAALSGIPLIFRKVMYYEALPTINPYTMSQEEIFKTLLFSKTKRWDYEEEYRIVRQKNPNNVIGLGPDTIESVILGLRCSEENEEVIKDILRAKHSRISLYRVDRMVDSRNMDLVKIIY